MQQLIIKGIEVTDKRAGMGNLSYQVGLKSKIVITERSNDSQLVLSAKVNSIIFIDDQYLITFDEFDVGTHLIIPNKNVIKIDQNLGGF